MAYSGNKSNNETSSEMESLPFPPPPLLNHQIHQDHRISFGMMPSSSSCNFLSKDSGAYDLGDLDQALLLYLDGQADPSAINVQDQRREPAFLSLSLYECPWVLKEGISFSSGDGASFLVSDGRDGPFHSHGKHVRQTHICGLSTCFDPIFSGREKKAKILNSSPPSLSPRPSLRGY